MRNDNSNYRINIHRFKKGNEAEHKLLTWKKHPVNSEVNKAQSWFFEKAKLLARLVRVREQINNIQIEKGSHRYKFHRD